MAMGTGQSRIDSQFAQCWIHLDMQLLELWDQAQSQSRSSHHCFQKTSSCFWSQKWQHGVWPRSPYQWFTCSDTFGLQTEFDLTQDFISRFHDHESGLSPRGPLVIQHHWCVPVLAWTWSKCRFLMSLKKAVTSAQWHCNTKESARHVVVQRQDCWEASLEHLVYGCLWMFISAFVAVTY